MRQTLQEYTIEYGNSVYDSEIAIKDVLNYAKLTNRAPRLGDFVPCDKDGNVLEDPLKDLEMTIVQFIKLIGGIKVYKKHPVKEIHAAYQAAKDRVIFAGDWEVIDQDKHQDYIEIKSRDALLIRFYNTEEILCSTGIGGYVRPDRIEDLPREITFKTNVI